jgi:hypothetical protein
MRAPAVVEIKVAAKSGARLRHAGIGVQVHLFILHRAPEPFDKYVVALGRLAIHADHDSVFQQ